MTHDHGYNGELDKRWSGWNSPVGLGLLILCVGIATAAIIAAVSLL